MKASLEDAESGKVQVESSTLFITMKLSFWQELYVKIFGFK